MPMTPSDAGSGDREGRPGRREPPRLPRPRALEPEAVGLGVTVVLAPYAEELLFQVSPRDPAVLGGVAAALLTVALLASLLPGLRATRVDPMDALRSE